MMMVCGMTNNNDGGAIVRLHSYSFAGWMIIENYTIIERIHIDAYYFHTIIVHSQSKVTTSPTS